MPIKVFARKGEPYSRLLKRFKKNVQRSRLLSDIKKNRRYEKPSSKKRRSYKDARRKMEKAIRKAKQREKRFS